MAPTRDGAAIVLVREGDPARFLWAKRTDDAPTLRGFHVYPGGLLEPSDAGLPNDGGEDVALRVAGLRELFEETGILVAHGADELDEAAIGQLRDRFLEDESPGERFAELGLRFRTAELVSIGRWLTPEFAPKRSDARFYALHVAECLEPSLDIRELDHAEWVDAPAAYARWGKGDVLIPPPVAALIRDLCMDGRLDDEGMRAVYGAQGEGAQRWEVVPWIQLLPFRTPTLPPATHTNSYLVGSGQGLIVEPATPFGDELERMLRWIEESKRDGIEPIAIFATHHHIDHVGAIETLKEALGLPLWAHRMTAQRLEGQAVIDRLIEHDERIVLDGPTKIVLRAVHTPGHAPGHLCLLDEASGALIAGDMVASEGSIIVEPTDGDMTLYLRSLREMIALEPTMMLPAHGMPITDPRALLEHYIAHRLDREAKVRAALRSFARPAQPMDLVPVVYEDTPRVMWPFAAMALESHLIKLVEDGEARRSHDGWLAL